MNRLNPSELFQFSRRYRIANGKLRSLRVRTRRGVTEIQLSLAIRTAIQDLGEGAKPVRMKFLMKGVSEYRFQKRPSISNQRIDVSLGYFDGLIYVNLEAMSLPSGDAPAVHDFRASEAFAAAEEVQWEEIRKPKKR